MYLLSRAGMSMREAIHRVMFTAVCQLACKGEDDSETFAGVPCVCSHRLSCS